MLAQDYSEAGWTIRSIDTEQFIAEREKELGTLFWIGVIIGLFLFIIPGLLIAALGYANRGTETRVITRSQAEARFEQRAGKRA